MRIALTCGRSQLVEEGGPAFDCPLRPDLYRRAAAYVDRVLRDANPADLPIERPTKFELFVNLKTANALGRTIPPSVVVSADMVVE